jgi:putative effector of murein hydrolase
MDNQLSATILSLLITIFAYRFSRWLGRKTNHPLFTPILPATIIAIWMLTTLEISYEEYEWTYKGITYLLGPATVALAVPLYHHWPTIRKYFLPSLIGIIVGSTVTLLAAITLAHLLGVEQELSLPLLLKSITTPVAVEVGKIIHLNPTLIAFYVTVTGMTGAVFGGWWMKWARITDPLARGLSFGTISHGIGTSEAVKEGELQGAVSAVSMGVAAVLTACLIPVIISFINS